MQVDEVELRLVKLPFRAPFKTSFAVETEKVAILVTVRADGTEGYGEGVMDPLPVFREESIAGARCLIENALVPDLLERAVEHPSELPGRWARWRGNPMAKAAVEGAVWDCFARQAGASLRLLLAPESDLLAVPVGASLGMSPIDVTVASVGRHVDEGYRRIKLKVEPGWDLELLAAVRAEFPAIELTVDAQRCLHARRFGTAPRARRLRPALHRTAAPLGRPSGSRGAGVRLVHADLSRREPHVAGAASKPRWTSARVRW